VANLKKLLFTFSGPDDLLNNLLKNYTRVLNHPVCIMEYCNHKEQTEKQILKFLVHMYLICTFTTPTTGHEKVECDPLEVPFNALKTQITGWDILSELIINKVIFISSGISIKYNQSM
jgi:hypothetical protein